MDEREVPEEISALELGDEMNGTGLCNDADDLISGRKSAIFAIGMGGRGDRRLRGRERRVGGVRLVRPVRVGATRWEEVCDFDDGRRVGT